FHVNESGADARTGRSVASLCTSSPLASTIETVTTSAFRSLKATRALSVGHAQTGETSGSTAVWRIGLRTSLRDSVEAQGRPAARGTASRGAAGATRATTPAILRRDDRRLDGWSHGPHTLAHRTLAHRCGGQAEDRPEDRVGQQRVVEDALDEDREQGQAERES